MSRKTNRLRNRVRIAEGRRDLAQRKTSQELAAARSQIRRLEKLVAGYGELAGFRATVARHQQPFGRGMNVFGLQMMLDVDFIRFGMLYQDRGGFSNLSYHIAMFADQARAKIERLLIEQVIEEPRAVVAAHGG